MAHYIPVTSCDGFEQVCWGIDGQIIPAMDYMPPVMYRVQTTGPRGPPPGFGHNPSASHFFNPQIPLQPFPLYIPDKKLPNQRRPRAISIIDPATGKDILNEIYKTHKFGGA